MPVGGCMKVKAIYFSPTGTTKEVITTIAKSLSNEIKFVDATLEKHRKSIPSIEEDLLIVGVPVYSGRIPHIMDSYLKSLIGNDTPCVVISVYGNREYDDALLELKDIMIERGFKPIAAGAFIGTHSYTTEVAVNRPDKKDLEICRIFANDILTSMDKKGKLLVKGQYPYKIRKAGTPFAPKIDERCLSCGICAINCPSGALTYNGKLKINESLCIKCNACIRKCPIGSIGFRDQLDPFIEWLKENCSERKEPEYFLVT